MKTFLVAAAWALTVIALPAHAQAPADYRLTIEWWQRDMDGNVQSHRIADGKIEELSRPSFAENTFRLEDWSMTDAGKPGRAPSPLEKLEGMNLEISYDNFTRSDYYKDFPPEHIELIRWIVQDKFTFDTYAQMYRDSLQLNVPFYPDFFQNHRAEFEDYANFNTQKLNITWLGYAEMNGKNCKLIYYQSLYSRIDADTEQWTTSGRDCFWGHIWVATDTGQIELATMNEDLTNNLKLKSDGSERLVNTQRELMFRKIE